MISVSPLNIYAKDPIAANLNSRQLGLAAVSPRDEFADSAEEVLIRMCRFQAPTTGGRAFFTLLPGDVV